MCFLWTHGHFSISDSRNVLFNFFFFYLFLSTFYKTKSLEGSYQRFCLEDDTTYFRILSMRIMRMRKSSPSSNKHPSLYPCSPSQRDSCPLEALMSVGPAGIFSVWPAHSQLEGMQNLFTLLLWLWKQVYVFFFFFFFLFLWKVSGWWTVVVQPQVTHPASILRYCGFSNAYSVVLDGWTEYKLARQFPNLLFSVLYTHKHTHSYINFQTLTHTCTFLTLVLIWSQAYRHSTFSEF